ncbi:MAG: redoxin family protein [Thermaerobacter sp.]|nr:redoxin family protein [Thermaerobacter sp.]
MRVSEAARRAGVTVRALRYYEKLGLVTPRRAGNDYREYDPLDVALVREIKGLMDLGFAVSDTRPFLECLLAGNARADVCPESLAAYRRAIDDLSERIEQFAARRATLVACLDAAIGMVPGSRSDAVSLDLPWPPGPNRAAEDDATSWRWPLAGRRMPPVELRSTDGETVRLGVPWDGRTVIYLYPLTGSPLVDLPKGWETIPGARGCTAEACNFRDHHAELLDAGVQRVFGLSSQSTQYQREVVERLRLPFAMLSDERLALAQAMGLPTFEAEGMRLFRRLTLIVRRGIVEHAFYPVDAPERHGLEVLEWLRAHPER